MATIITIEQLTILFKKLRLNDRKPQPQLPPPRDLSEVEKIINYEFKNKDLLKEAFTHISYKPKDRLSYERLEYLGDSLLNHLIAKLHFTLYNKMAPGELSRLRAAIVDTEALARAALKHGLQHYLHHKKPLLNGQIQDFMEGTMVYPSHSHGLIDPPKDLADIVESLIGAVFVDTGSSYDATWEVIKCLLQPFVTPENLMPHPAARFNEACQKKGLKPYMKDMWSKTGEIEIHIDNELVGSGKFKLKRIIAMNRAADDAYKKLFGNLGNQDGGIGA